MNLQELLAKLDTMTPEQFKVEAAKLKTAPKAPRAVKPPESDTDRAGKAAVLDKKREIVTLTGEIQGHRAVATVLANVVKGLRTEVKASPYKATLKGGRALQWAAFGKVITGNPVVLASLERRMLARLAKGISEKAYNLAKADYVAAGGKAETFPRRNSAGYLWITKPAVKAD